MFKKILILFLLTISYSSFADSVLSQLPFGIKIGVTTNKEIENRGVCVKQIQVSDNYFRCEIFNMLNGKFQVSSSENEVVSLVAFVGSVNHTLPQPWQKLGLRLGDGKEDSTTKVPMNAGISEEQFLSIIKKEGVSNINITHPNGNFVINTITFDIDNNHYEARFPKYYYESMNYTALYGLVDIVVTEGY